MPNSEMATAGEKIRIVELYLSGKIGYSEAGKQAGVDRKTVARWVSRYKMEGAAGFLPQEHDRVYSKETKLSAVLEYLSGKGSLQEICGKTESGILGNSGIG
jgi:transposase-like protein